MAWSKFWTTDKIIACGLVLALIMSLFLGGNEKLQNDIGIGLVGLLGRGLVDKGGGADGNKSTKVS
jgi:hypothetical protein